MNFGQRLKSFFSAPTTTQPLTNLDYSPNRAKKFKTKDEQIRANIGWVFAASQLISDDCSTQEIELWKKLPDGTEEQVFQHEILELLNDPTSLMTPRQLWSLYYQYLNLTGETYLLKLDKQGKPITNNAQLPAALFPLPSHMCELKLNNDDYNKSVIVFNGQEFTLDQVIRDINPDPENIFKGLSVISKVSLAVDTDERMKNWNNKLFINGARPSLALEVPGELSEKNFERLNQQIKEKFVGDENTFKHIILENGMRVNPYMMNQQDLDFLSSREFTRDEILSFFKLSKANLGIVDDVNRANNEAQEYRYAKQVIKPRIEQFADIINRRLIKPVYGTELFIRFKNPIPEDKDRILQEAQAGINKWLTIDEVREVYGYEALPDGAGQEIYTELNKIKLSDLNDITQNTPQDADTSPQSEDKPEDDKDTPNEDNSHTSQGNTPNAEQSEEENKEDKSVEAEIQDEALIKKRAIGNNKVQRRTIQAQRYEKKLLKTSRKMFDRQKSQVLNWLEKNKPTNEKQYQKALIQKIKTKDWADEMIDWNKEQELFQQDIATIQRTIIETVGLEEYNALISNDDKNFNTNAQSIDKFILDTSELASLTITDETKKQIKATLSEAIHNGETLNEMTARVEETFGTMATKRAQMIAQTEVATALNQADIEAWTQTELVEAKEWFTGEDEKTCGYCQSMDGKIISLQSKFFHKGDKIEFEDAHEHSHHMNLDYKDITAPPIHPHCRCALLPVLKTLE